MKLKLTFILFLFLTAASQIHSQEGAESNKDASKQFDFWIGSWDVYTAGNEQPIAQSKIESILNGMAILENYEAGQFSGKSLNSYNVATGKWQQHWVDNAGNVLQLEGGLVGDDMILSQSAFDLETKLYTIDRISWTPNDDGTVRQIWEQFKTEGNMLLKISEGGKSRRC